MTHPKPNRLIFLCGLALLLSCTPSPQHPELVQVIGVVQFDNEPADGVVLTLVPKDGTGNQSQGRSQQGSVAPTARLRSPRTRRATARFQASMT